MMKFELRLPVATIRLFVLIGVIACSPPVNAGELFVGAATVSITPDGPVSLTGQRHTRIAKKVESPCTATALAIETRDDDRSIDQVVFVSCDLVAIRGDGGLKNLVLAELGETLEGFSGEKLILNATHTHTAPTLIDGRYKLPETGVMLPKEYREFLVKRLAAIITEAWTKREPAQVAWGLGHAVIAQNRRAVYSDGTAQMYGATNSDKFRGLEGNEDHGVEILYFWNEKDELIATSINVACPSQEVGGRSAVNADFWHPVREALRKKYGEQLMVLAWTGAAGDQVSRLMYRKDAEERMRKLRGIDRLEELARRIVTTWEDVYQVVKADRRDDVLLEHQVKDVLLPYRKVTAQEAEQAAREVEKMTDPKEVWNRRWHGQVVERYETQRKELPNYEMELHAVRLGDVVVVTNDFELFTDFGVQIKARSPALQTFVIQLCGPGSYVPTTRAVAGGGYSAVAQSSVVGPDGAQVLVNETSVLIDSLWRPKQKVTLAAP
ncbi:hypothetical protein DSM3645_00615 [Blastopirellula marina DSM 3645]|uniref:Neutral/alkaline non-lysosomal ceramidase N-terminal domain-containing protein n=2 Tax=Blastopirellula marina TaxID=124 RepID=A3ZMJ8_9BACT|nr:hypothetical protein DSM3645_00615 [Blastopirellula marina DSM 3645]